MTSAVEENDGIDEIEEVVALGLWRCLHHAVSFVYSVF